MISIGTLARWSRNISLAGAAVAAMLAAGAAAPAQATTYTYNFSYDASALQCGTFGVSVICAESQQITPVASVAGDQFNIHVTSSQPIVVPGSPTQSLLFVGVADATAALGPGAPGGILSTANSTPIGFVGAPGAPAPLIGPFNNARASDALSFVGYCCGYGVPDSGFSLTGVDVSLLIVAADPLPFGGVYVGYVYDLPRAAIPEPGAWAMMLLGFAGVGAALRRRRASA